MLNSLILQSNNRLPYEHSRLLNLLLPLVIVLAGVVRFGYGGNLNLSMQVSMESATLCIFAIILWRINPFVSMFLLLGLWAAHYPVYGKSAYLALNSLVYGLMLFAAIYYIGRRYNTDMLMNGICVLACANIILMVLQALGVDPFYTNLTGVKYYVGFNGNTNFNGAFLVFCLPAFIRERWIYLLPIVVIAALMTASFGVVACLLSALVYVTYSYFSRDEMLIVCSVAGLLAIVYWMGFDAPDFRRADIWRDGWFLYKQNWLDGAGLGQWKNVALQMQMQGFHIGGFKTWTVTLHNEYLQIIFEMGIKVIFVLAGYLAYLYSGFHKVHRRTAVAVIFILTSCFINAIFHHGTTAMIAVIWLSIFEIERGERDEL